jgi:hypothetical protein
LLSVVTHPQVSILIAKFRMISLGISNFLSNLELELLIFKTVSVKRNISDMTKVIGLKMER